MKPRGIAILGVAFALTAAGLPATASAASLASVSVKKPGFDPLGDTEAASRVNQTNWEPRPGNVDDNRRRPDDDQIRDFRRRSYLVNRHDITGRYRGTTDEILQWAARKWGFDPDLFRAVAYVESSWKMSTVGDGGLSFGLFQMKVTHHCCLPLSSRYSAFNADYYGAILRAYYDGRETWLNDFERGERYHSGDLWGSVGTWFAGRWRTGPALDYIRKVQGALRDEPWHSRWF